MTSPLCGGMTSLRVDDGRCATDEE